MRARWLRPLVWTLFGLTLLLTAASLVFLFQTLDVPTAPFGFRGATHVLALSIPAVGALLASRRPENSIGWILLGVGVVAGVQLFAAEYGILAGASGNARGAAIGNWVDSWLWVPITGAIAIYVFLLFPTGRPPSPRWRWLLWTGATGIILFGGSFFLGSTDLGFRNPFFRVGEAIVSPMLAVGSILYLTSVGGAAASLVVRFRRSSGEQRQQLRWFALAASSVALFAALTFISELLIHHETMARITSVGMVLSFVAVPAATGVAILKYRLYELDVVIRRAVLYGALVAAITLVYVGIVVGVGALVGSRDNLLLSILATAIIALAFQPLRERVGRFANRLVYGKRATPYEVLSEFAAGIGAVYSADEVLPRMARLLGEGTGGETGVWVHVGEEIRLAASWPETGPAARVAAGPGDELPQFEGWDRAYAVRHRGEMLGALTVRKPPQEPMTEAEERLVASVASQAGLVLGNVRLIEELRASRQRLVTAQDEERRRLERDIHDGAQQQLVAMAVKLRLARTLASKDPAKAEQMLEQLQAENQDTLETLRDLARGIYPPLLADQGLAAALDAQARKAALPVEVTTDGVGRFPQDAEAAAYFSCLEALQNVAKYAEASRVTVRLWTEDGTLAFAVEDDGKGFDPRRTPSGSGLRNMADRLEALGGSIELRSAPGEGTTVEGRIPAQPEVAAAQASASRSGSNSDLGM
jgi:signal transduction histidine kinase